MERHEHKDVVRPTVQLKGVCLKHWRALGPVLTIRCPETDFQEWTLAFLSPAQALTNHSLPTIFVNKVLLEQSNVHPFRYCLWLLSCSYRKLNT